MSAEESLPSGMGRMSDMNKHLEKYKDKLPKSVKYVEDNLTNFRCIRCGSPILLEPEIEDYPYQCLTCDENMYSFEVEASEQEVTAEEIENIITYLTQQMGLDIKDVGTVITRKRATELVRELLTAIDDHCDEFSVKVDAILGSGITEEELKLLGFDYMVAYIEDYKEKNE